jgi:hypothetical protein
MRLLLSFILLSSCCFAAAKSNAGTVRDTRESILTAGNIPTTSIINHLFSDDHSAVISNTEQRSNSITRYRSFSHADFFITDCLIKKTIPFPEIKYFVAPHLYCKAIGLKLLFPKHYFW